MCIFAQSLDNGDVTGINPVTNKEVRRTADVNEPLAALAFKIATDSFVGRLAYLRVYSGKIEAGSQVLNTRTNRKERISRLYQMHSNKQNPKDVIEAGEYAQWLVLKIFALATHCLILSIP